MRRNPKPPRNGPSLARGRLRAFRQSRSQQVVSRGVEELLFQCAEVLSEGQVREETYFGSTMLTIPVSEIGARLGRDVPEEELGDALAGSARVRLRASRIARAEAQRRIPHRLMGTATVESRVTIEDGNVHVDVDLEVPLDVLSVT